jgi:mannose/fructose/N-acetylgalactosamine-specific phosphotransferase system component IIB
MKLTAEDFTRQYREMSDDELLAIDPDELHDVARKCHQAEMTRRSLVEQAEESEEANAGITESTGDLVSVATFVSMDAATAAYNALKNSNLAVTVEETPDGPSLMVPWPQQQAAYVAMNMLEQAGSELVQQWLQEILAGRAITIDDMLSQDDVVAARLTVDGRHQAFCFARIAEGKVAETWHNFDQLGLK